MGWAGNGWGWARFTILVPPPPPLQPDTLGALPNLRELWLDRNQLSALPPVSEVPTLPTARCALC